MCKFLCGQIFSRLLGVCLGVELLDQMVTLTFRGTYIFGCFVLVNSSCLLLLTQVKNTACLTWHRMRLCLVDPLSQMPELVSPDSPEVSSAARLLDVPPGPITLWVPITYL